MSKNSKSDLRESFRPALQVKSIGALKKEYPNHVIKQVRYDEHLDPDGDRIDRYLDNGWSIMSTTEKPADDRSTAPKSKETEALRPKPLTRNGKGKGGAKFVYMMIPKEDHLANQEGRKQRDEARLAAKQKKVKNTKDGMHLTGNEINDSNPNSNELG